VGAVARIAGWSRRQGRGPRTARPKLNLPTDEELEREEREEREEAACRAGLPLPPRAPLTPPLAPTANPAAHYPPPGPPRPLPTPPKFVLRPLAGLKQVAVAGVRRQVSALIRNCCSAPRSLAVPTPVRRAYYRLNLFAISSETATVTD
jgi:hypothetical protein